MKLTLEEASSVVKLIILGLVLHLAIVGYVFWTDYHGRQDQVEAARQGCERDRRSRALNAQGWWIAETARRLEGQIVIANRYKELAQELDTLAGINCIERYPEASLFP